MIYDKSLGFIGGLLLGGLVGATIALLLAPASGEKTREHIRSEGVALKDRSEQYGNDRIHDAQALVKQGQKGISDAQPRGSSSPSSPIDRPRRALSKAAPGLFQQPKIRLRRSASCAIAGVVFSKASRGLVPALRLLIHFKVEIGRQSNVKSKTENGHAPGLDIVDVVVALELLDHRSRRRRARRQRCTQG